MSRRRIASWPTAQDIAELDDRKNSSYLLIAELHESPFTKVATHLRNPDSVRLMHLEMIASDHRVDRRDACRVETDVTERHTFAGLSWDKTYTTVTYRPPLGEKQNYIAVYGYTENLFATGSKIAYRIQCEQLPNGGARVRQHVIVDAPLMSWHVVPMAKTAHMAMLSKLPKIIGTGKENFVSVHNEAGPGRKSTVLKHLGGCCSPAAEQEKVVDRLLPSPNTDRLPQGQQ